MDNPKTPDAGLCRLDPLVRQVPEPRFGHPVSPWHWWFAWHPVWTWDHRLVWLRRIQRRVIQTHDYLSACRGPGWWWQYHWEHGYLPNVAVDRNRREGGSEQ